MLYHFHIALLVFMASHFLYGTATCYMQCYKLFTFLENYLRIQHFVSFCVGADNRSYS